MTPEQLKYVKDELARGVSPEALKATLLQNGYGEDLATQLIIAAQNPDVPQTNMTANTTPETEEKTSMIKMIGIILAVVAVIILGLSFIVLASLNDARDAAMNASAQQTLSNARAQAELYYFNNSNTYSGFCESPEFLTLTSGMSGFDYDCEANVLSYRASVRLISDGSGPEYFCVDSTGAALKQSAPPVGLSCEY